MGNAQSLPKQNFYITKVTNTDLPLVPFIHTIIGYNNIPIRDTEPLALREILKTQDLVLDILDLVQNAKFKVTVPRDSIGSGKLGINVIKLKGLPTPLKAQVTVVKESAPTSLRAGDFILGIENVAVENEDELFFEIRSSKQARLVVLRDSKASVIEWEGDELGCEIGTGLLYAVPEGEYYMEGYSGSIKRVRDELVKPEIRHQASGSASPSQAQETASQAQPSVIQPSVMQSSVMQPHQSVMQPSVSQTHQPENQQSVIQPQQPVSQTHQTASEPQYASHQPVLQPQQTTQSATPHQAMRVPQKNLHGVGEASEGHPPQFQSSTATPTSGSGAYTPIGSINPPMDVHLKPESVSTGENIHISSSETTHVTSSEKTHASSGEKIAKAVEKAMSDHLPAMEVVGSAADSGDDATAGEQKLPEAPHHPQVPNRPNGFNVLTKDKTASYVYRSPRDAERAASSHTSSAPFDRRDHPPRGTDAHTAQETNTHMETSSDRIYREAGVPHESQYFQGERNIRNEEHAKIINGSMACKDNFVGERMKDQAFEDRKSSGNDFRKLFEDDDSSLPFEDKQSQTKEL